MSTLRFAVQIALAVTLTAAAIFTAAVGGALVYMGGPIEKIVGLLVVATAAVMVAAGLDGSVLPGRVTARIPAWALHGALPVCGVGAVGLGLLLGTQVAGAVAGLLLLPATAYIVLGLVSGTLLPHPTAAGPDEARQKARQRRGGRARKP